MGLLMTDRAKADNRMGENNLLTTRIIRNVVYLKMFRVTTMQTVVTMMLRILGSLFLPFIAGFLPLLFLRLPLLPLYLQAGLDARTLYLQAFLLLNFA